MSKVKLIKALQSVDNLCEYFAEERTQTIITDIRASIENSTALRDQLAMAAITGFNKGMVDYGWGEDVLIGHAKQAYAIADAMLKAREGAE